MDEDRRPDVREHQVSRIPLFETLQEEAEFWDSHDTSDFEDEFDAVIDVTFVRGEP